jgi:hypothetical protein
MKKYYAPKVLKLSLLDTIVSLCSCSSSDDNPWGISPIPW